MAREYADRRSQALSTARRRHATPPRFASHGLSSTNEPAGLSPSGTLRINRSERQHRLGHPGPYANLAWAVLLPLPATLLISAGEVVAGAAITTAISMFLAFAQARASVTDPRSLRYSFGIDAIMFLLIGIISAVVVGTIFSPGDSKLYRLHLAGFAGEADIAPSYLVIVWCFSLCTLPIASIRPQPGRTQVKLLNKATLWSLAALGTIGLAFSLTVSRYEVFSNRGESGGNGVFSLLYWSSAVFVSYVIVMQKQQHPRVHTIVAVLMAVGLLASGNRSPIALIGIALVVRVVMDRRTKIMAFLGALVPVGLVTFSYQSIWRSLVSKGLPSGPVDVFTVMLGNPTQEFLRLGLDTVDGHSLVTKIVSNGFEARWLDPLLAVANFVPRQLWDNKPILLGSTIGHDYLGLTAGGIFLSGPGYFSLVSNSMVLGSALFVIFILGAKQLTAIPDIHPIAVCAIYYAAARMSIAGDAFDIFLSVQILIILGISTFFGKAILWPQS